MPPQNSKSYKKHISETPASTDSSKKQKKMNDTAPSTPKKADPVLDIDLELLKAQVYINSYALSLFEEVKVPPLKSANCQSCQDFHVMTIIFWSSYFAYQHGQPAEGHKVLLDLVASKIDPS